MEPVEALRMRATILVAGMIAARLTDPHDTLIAKAIALARQIDSQVDVIPKATLLAKVR